LAERKSFYFAVRAYAGTRTSDYSNEVKAVVRTSTGGGQLIPTLTIPAAGSTVNLTSEGTSDWVHWGKESSSSVNRKAGGTGEIGALTTVGGSASRFNATDRLRYSWSDGTPTASATTQAGLYIAGLNKGYQLQVPADTSERTLVVYLGGWQARGRLEVSLSDGSAPAFVQTVENLSAAFDRRLALSYRAGSAGQTLTLRYLQETSTGNITVQATALQGASASTAPVASFTANGSAASSLVVAQGQTVTFVDTSTGTVTSRSWNLDDGTTATTATVVKSYSTAGAKTVKLTIQGPRGTDTATKTVNVTASAPPSSSSDGSGGTEIGASYPLQAGELEINHEWQRVEFSTPFSDPIVVAKPLSYNGSDPAVVRVKGIDATGFWIRVQEWDYLDGKHAYETVSYLVMERGRHQLPDGAWVEAGHLVTSATNTFVAQHFSEPLYETPVVFATVTSVNEPDAVTTRLRNVSMKGFEIGMQEQESKPQKHLAESIDFIAFEPSFGVVNGMRYEVELMSSRVTDKPQTLVYRDSYERAPLFLADMQTSNGMDTSSLRWENRNEVSTDLWVSEEQSKDSETSHTNESIGYFVAAADYGQLTSAITTPTGTADLTAEGVADWVHWGKDSASSVNRKAGGTGEIGALTTVGGSASRFNATNRLRYSWSDGTPTASATTQAGLYIAGLNKGYQLQVPADTSERTLVVYLGGWQARGRLEVSLSDGSAPAFVQTVENLSAAFDRRLALTYRAGSAGQTLTVRYLQETSTGNITVQAATLQETNGTGN